MTTRRAAECLSSARRALARGDDGLSEAVRHLADALADLEDVVRLLSGNVRLLVVEADRHGRRVDTLERRFLRFRRHEELFCRTRECAAGIAETPRASGAEVS